MTDILATLPIRVRVIPSLAVDSSRLTSTTVANPSAGETAWAAGTFAAGDVRTKDFRKYVSLQSGNTKTPGAADAAEWWQDVGPINQRAMFDLYTNIATIGASPMVVVITPGQRITSFAVSGIVGSELVVTYTQTAVVRKTWTLDLRTRDVYNWMTHFTEPFTNKDAIAQFDVPQYSDGFLTFTLSSDDSTDVSIAYLVIGKAVDLGSAERPSRVSGQNYSTVTRNAATTLATMVPRRSIPKITLRVLQKPDRTSAMLRAKEELNAVPAFYCGIDDDTHDFFEAMQMVGFYRIFDLDFTETECVYIDLETEAI